MHRSRPLAALAALLALAAGPAAADLSAFVGYVGFDSEANLESSPSLGVRWGKSRGLIGGETSLMIARPERDLGTRAERATAIFYEGRILVNIPMGDVRPFANVGFGAITTTSTDVVGQGLSREELDILQTAADLQTKSAFSYGVGARYALSDRLDLRADLRQYQVFSVAGVVVSQAAQAAGIETEDKTVQYTEISVGCVINF